MVAGVGAVVEPSGIIIHLIINGNIMCSVNKSVLTVTCHPLPLTGLGHSHLCLHVTSTAVGAHSTYEVVDTQGVGARGKGVGAGAGAGVGEPSAGGVGLLRGDLDHVVGPCPLEHQTGV